ncbi:MAG: hypothetical protein ACRDPS_10735 [Nocardioides sp.]|uniref:hypothetical protein n=1 Tax=Nocardioides sp. TaxID=35761 RepID=UPI003D6AD31D
MSIPDVPSVFKQPSAAERPWWWKLVDGSGEEVSAGDEYAGQRFANQGDAESWVGEVWQELLDAGVTAVILFEHDRQVYGPMNLSA